MLTNSWWDTNQPIMKISKPILDRLFKLQRTWYKFFFFTIVVSYFQLLFYFWSFWGQKLASVRKLYLCLNAAYNGVICDIRIIMSMLCILSNPIVRTLGQKWSQNKQPNTRNLNTFSSLTTSDETQQNASAPQQGAHTQTYKFPDYHS